MYLLRGRDLPVGTRTGEAMGWRLAISGLPDGYQVLEKEDGLTLLSPAGRVVAEFGPMLSDLSVIVRAAWDDAQESVEG